MHILVATDSFPPASNAGAEQVAYRLATEYQRQGHEVTVLTTWQEIGNGRIKEERFSDFPVVYVGSSYSARWISYRSLWNPPVLKAVRSWLRGRYFDIAHLHNIHCHLSYRFIDLLYQRKIPVVLTAHDAMTVEHGKFIQGVNPEDFRRQPEINYRVSPLKSLRAYRFRYNPFRNLVIRHEFRKLSRIITVSGELERLLNANGITNTETIHNGVRVDGCGVDITKISDFQRKHRLEQKRVMLWAGRLSAAKGSRQVYDVVKKLLPTFRDIVLLICGEKHRAKDIMNRAYSDGISSAFWTTGWLSPEEMTLAYQVADLVMLPSIYVDPFPTVVLEAMSHRCPIIVSCFGGAKEAVIDGETGFVVNPFDVAAVTERTFLLLNDSKLGQRMGHAAYDRVVNFFSLEHICQRYLHLFGAVINR